jgi:UDP-N-acetyl-D-mannosaminuronate dehydrogenase
MDHEQQQQLTKQFDDFVERQKQQFDAFVKEHGITPDQVINFLITRLKKDHPNFLDGATQSQISKASQILYDVDAIIQKLQKLNEQIIVFFLQLVRFLLIFLVYINRHLK